MIDPTQLNQVIHLLEEINRHTARLIDMGERQIPIGRQFSVDGEVAPTGQWAHIPFTSGPLFSFTLINIGTVGLSAPIIQYRLEGTTGAWGNLNIGDAVPFSASVGIFSGVEVRVIPGTTLTGNYRIIGLA